MGDDAIREHMQRLPTDELLRLVQRQQHDFRPEALAIARAELEARRVSPDQPIADEPADDRGVAVQRAVGAGTLVRRLWTLLSAPVPQLSWSPRARVFFSAARLTIAIGLVCLGLIDYSFLWAPGQSNVGGGLVVVVPISLLVLGVAHSLVVGGAAVLASLRFSRPWAISCVVLALVHLGWGLSAPSDLAFLRWPLIGSAAVALLLVRRDRGNLVLLLPVGVIAARLVAWGASAGLRSLQSS